MLPKNKLFITFLCVASLLVGFIAVPTCQFVRNLDFSSLTDSAYASAGGIDVSRLSTPSDGYHAWTSPKGNLYIGIWKNGTLENGTLITEKSVYEGDLLNFSPHGYGTMYYNNGNIYRGNWAVGNKEGIGLKHNRDGSMFFGHWRAGLFNAPKNAMYKVEDFVYGIDISHHQRPDSLKWNQLALYSNAYGELYSHKTEEHQYMHPVTFAYIRATCYANRDSCYYKHLETARKHKIIVGAYHFFTINKDVDSQIDIYINTVKYKKGDLPPMLDLENEGGDELSNARYVKKLNRYGVKEMQNGALKWLKAIEQYYHVKPIIYTSEKWKRDFLNDKRFDEYEFWYARYYNVRPREENKWVFWQRTDAAQPHGYKGGIDVDIFNGSFMRFMEYRKSIYNK